MLPFKNVFPRRGEHFCLGGSDCVHKEAVRADCWSIVHHVAVLPLNKATKNICTYQF